VRQVGDGAADGAQLIAKTLVALGIIKNDQLCEAWGAARPGCVTFIDQVDDDARELDKISDHIEKLEAAAQAQGVPVMIILASREKKVIATLASRLIPLQKREPYKLQLAPFTSAELALMTLQKVAGKLSLADDITLALVTQAIEGRWSLGEREERNVYIANDMAEYLLQESVLQQTQVGRGNQQLQLASERADEKSLPYEIEALLAGFGKGQAGGSSIGLENLGLPATLFMKEAARSSAAMADQKSELVSARTARAAAAAEVAQAKMLKARVEADQEIIGLVGMSGIKKWVDEMRGKVRYTETSGNLDIIDNSCLNMVLTGNPG
jgi:hypothetical protein